MKREIRIKRAYERVDEHDGLRVLVDRIWPRGLRKDELRLDIWAKEIAPSKELRQWFGHDPQRWPEFRKRYKQELRSLHVREKIREILERAGDAPAITLVYGASDTLHNQAVVLRELFEETISMQEIPMR